MQVTTQPQPRVFGTLPASADVEGDYLGAVAETAAWCEEGGCTGVLIYTDNSLVESVARGARSHSRNLHAEPTRGSAAGVHAPVLGGQAHRHDCASAWAARVSEHGRQGFVNDLIALADEEDHDRRYDRVVEYASIIKRLLSDDGPVTFTGEWYQVKNLRLQPAVPERLRPGTWSPAHHLPACSPRAPSGPRRCSTQTRSRVRHC